MEEKKLNRPKNGMSPPDLEKKVADGSFRADLYYRINVFPINVTLSERNEDIPLLINIYWII